MNYLHVYPHSICKKADSTIKFLSYTIDELKKTEFPRCWFLNNCNLLKLLNIDSMALPEPDIKEYNLQQNMRIILYNNRLKELEGINHG